jgi:rRNA processing protein Gar1
MAKKSITWIELINVKISERKKAGKPAGVSDVMGDAKSDWAKIKAGSHPDYEVGKSTGPKTRKAKKAKAEKVTNKGTRKHGETTSAHGSVAEHLESCDKCMKMVKRHMKKELKGGATPTELPSPPTYPTGDPIAMSGIFPSNEGGNAMSGGASDCGCGTPPPTPMMGGKKHKKKGTKKH